MSLRRRIGAALNVIILGSVAVLAATMAYRLFPRFRGDEMLTMAHAERVPAPSAAADSGGQSTTFTAAELKGMLDGGTDVLVVDIRSREEFAKEHVPSAVNIPHDEIHTRALDELPTSKLLVISSFQCNDDEVSRVIRDDLVRLGFSNAGVLAGGIDGWKKASFATAAAAPSDTSSRPSP